jgi:hypothetical protein
LAVTVTVAVNLCAATVVALLSRSRKHA